MLLAELATRNWPDGIDLSATLSVAALLVGIPIAGYICLVVDIRRYLRRLKGVLVVVTQRVFETPTWASNRTPRCLVVMGLSYPCTEEDLMAAYRDLVKKHHPDRGGNRKEFHRLQTNFENALYFLRSKSASDAQHDQAQQKSQ